MIIQLNGERRELQTALSISSLLQSLDITNKGIAIECNKQVVMADAWQGTILKEGDVVEIVQLVGGGSV